MPKFSDKNNYQNGPQEYTEMEIEDNVQHGELIKINVDNIENEIIESENGYTYNPGQLQKCFIPKTDLAKELTTITLKMYLINMKIKSLKKENIEGINELYIINKTWYDNWKKFCKYPTVKRTISAFSTYSANPIPYNPKEENKPGIINNKDLYIKNKLNNNDGRNILISKNNNAYDTRVKVGLLIRDRFNLLKNYFKCDEVIKLNKAGEFNNKTYDEYCVHLNLVFLPTIEKFKEVNDENYEAFYKKYNVLYDTYFRQKSRGDEISVELKSIIKERPDLLATMGVKFLTENSEDELMNHFNFLKFYIPYETNTKSPKEMLDLILSKESIEKIKKDTKISSEDIPIYKNPFLYREISELFHVTFTKNEKRNNIDNLKNGLILVEYIPCDKSEEQIKYSIFEEEKNPPKEEHYETAAYRYNDESQTIHDNKVYKKDYNLEDYPLNEKENKNGLVGLNNLGNTCYMNTGLQCLSNCELLTKYFLGNYYQKFINKDNPMGSKGEIVEKYSQLIHHIWQGNQEYISPIQFKKAFGEVYTALNNCRQQDTQEFISYLLDSLHEDLNKVLKKPYIEMKDLPNDLSDEEIFKIKKDLYLSRNQSFIADLIYGFYKSTIFCPDKKCNNIIKSFEPFNMITLSLINETELRKIEEFKEEQNKKLGIKELTVTFIPFKINYKPLCFKVRIKKDMDVFTFKKKIETITKFNLNTFEIYKTQGNEYLPMKDDIYLMEDFLKGEKKIYLVQIPPYVFGKKLDFFDKNYMRLISDMDSFFLEEEKYEGNDLYKEYNKEQKKAKTDEDLEIKNNRMEIHIDDIENGAIKERKERKASDGDERLKNEIIMEINDIRNKAKDELKLSNQKKIDEIEDTEMEDATLHLDKSDWVKAELYNYSYQLKGGKIKSSKEERISKSRIIYINKNWSNAQLYDCILDILDGARPDMPEIKQIWYQDLKDITINLDQINKSKSVNIYDQFHELNAHPLMLQYLRYYNFTKENIMKKGDKHENSIFIYDPEKYEIKDILSSAKKCGNNVDDIEILFKIVWKQNFAEEYKEGIKPKNLEKSEKLEDILKVQREDEFLKKNNISKSEIDSKNSKKKKLNLDELLTNFNQIEKLSKDNEWYCPKCKKMQLADKKMEIYSISEVVIIHLKRFRNNRKIENLVEFPIEGLDLTKYLSKTKDKYIYDLFAVANHTGGLHGGHYYAYCKNVKDGEWYKFNDTHVSKIEKKKVCSETAYVLFYRRKREKNEKINEEELFNKPFVEIDCSKYKSN